MSYVPVGGTKLGVKQTTGAASYTDLGCITEISINFGTRPSSTVACISTPAKHKRPGITEPGQVTFGVEFDHQDTGHIWLAGELAAAVKDCVHSWQVTVPPNSSGSDLDTATLTFDAFVSEFTVDESDVDGSIIGNLTLDLVGVPVLATVAAS